MMLVIIEPNSVICHFTKGFEILPHKHLSFHMENVHSSTG